MPTLSWIDLSKVFVAENSVARVREILDEHGFAVIPMRRFFEDVVLKEFPATRYYRGFIVETGDCYYLVDSKKLRPESASRPLDAASEAAVIAYCCAENAPSLVP